MKKIKEMTPAEKREYNRYRAAVRRGEIVDNNHGIDHSDEWSKENERTICYMPPLKCGKGDSEIFDSICIPDM